MSSVFDDCLSSPGAEYYREVIIRGERFATIRALRPLDNDRVYPPGSYRVEKTGVVETEKTPGFHEAALRRLCCRLGGTIDGRSMRVGDEGWVLPGQITVEALNLLPADIITALLDASAAMDTDWGQRREAYEKNSEATSG